MLESLFPDGLDRPPAIKESLVYSHLGHAYQIAGRLLDAHVLSSQLSRHPRRQLTN
jgi:hypothetical protein